MVEQYSHVGNYTLLRRLGNGFNSIVKLARHNVTGRHYAMKIIKRTGTEVDEEHLEFVIKEV
jgi:serine/threonine protein kinase